MIVGRTEVRLDRRLHQPRWLGPVVPVASVLAALAVGAVFLSIEGLAPITVYRQMLESGFTTWYGFTDSLSVATPLILTGLAAAVTFRMGLYNIGAEGQLYAGAIASAGAALAFGDDLPALLAIGVTLLAGAFGGALWILVPAITRATIGTSEVITTLLLNYVALFLMRYLIFGSSSYWSDPTATQFPQGKPIPSGAELPEFGTTRVHWGLVVALVLVVLLWLLVVFTRFGFDMRVIGDSPPAARYAGIPLRRTLVIVMLLSGAFAGLAGATEVAGRAHALDPNGLELSLGYTGIVVAALARHNPFGLAVVALLLGGLTNAASTLQSLPGNRVPIAVSLMLQGGILLFVLGGEMFRRYRLVVVRHALPAEVVELGEAAT